MLELDPVMAADRPTFTAPVLDAGIATRAQWRTVLRRFVRHRLAVAATIILLAITAWAFVGPLFWHLDYATFDTSAKNLSPRRAHPFGTDDLGKDLYARVMRGVQRSLEIAFIVSLLSTTIGVTIGAVSGYFRSRIDAVLMRLTDLVLVVPLLVTVAVLGASVDDAPWWVVPLLLGLFSWPTMARVTRGEVMSWREKEFVEAAVALGVPSRRIVFAHILPNLAGTIIVNATLTIANAILIETALSFLGLGIREPEVSLGLLMNLYQTAYNTRPWLFWFPSIAIVVICLCVNFIGDGLRDAFDPKQNRQRS